MTMKIKTLGGAAAMYAKMGKNVDYRPPLRASAKKVTGNNIRRFDREVDPNGKRWKPLSKSYSKAKLKKYKGKRSKLNVDTSVLRTSITSNADALAKYNLANDRVQFGTNVKYAGHVQKVRPFIGMDKQDIKDIGELFAIYQEKLLFNANKASKK